MGVFVRSKVGLERIADDERSAPALPLGEPGKPGIQRRRELQREHRVTDKASTHTRIMGTRELRVNTNQSHSRVHSWTVGQESGATLGPLIKSRCESVRPKMSQAELGRLIGLDQRSVSNIENGTVKSLTPEVANKLPGVIPITMAEIVRAHGFNLPAVHSTLDEDMLEALESAPQPVLDAVRLVLDGWRAMQQATAREKAS